jgi:dUTP pyrophosphatase
MPTDRVPALRFKRLVPEAVLPSYATPGSAGLDLTATSCRVSADGSLVTYGTGLAVAIPEGYVGLLFPRSSVCKMGLSLANSVGVIDSDYRGELLVAFYAPEGSNLYTPGARMAQLVVVPLAQFPIESAEDLGDTQRGSGGFGSTN